MKTPRVALAFCFLFLFLHGSDAVSPSLTVSFQDESSISIGFSFGSIPEEVWFFEEYSFKLVTALQLNSVQQLCEQPSQSQIKDEAHRQTLVLVEAGQCSILEKLKTAEELGYDGLIVYQLERTTQETKMLPYEFQVSHSNLPILIISQENAQLLIEKIEEKGEEVSVYYMLDPIEKSPNGQLIPVDMWGTPHSTGFMKFIGDVMECDQQEQPTNVTERLCLKLMEDEHINFEPHYLVFRKNNETDEENCLNDYCSPDPDGPGILSGKNETYQSLVQKCVFKEYGVDGWFRYTFKYTGACARRAEKVENDLECSRKAMSMVDVKPNIVHDCIANATEEDGRIEILEEEINEARQVSITMEEVPQVFIGDFLFNGEFMFQNFKAKICSVYSALNLEQGPLVCDHDETTFETEEVMGLAEDFLGKLSVICIVLGVLLLCGVFLFFLISHRRNSELQSQVIDQKVQEYLLRQGQITIGDMRPNETTSEMTQTTTKHTSI